MNQPTEQPTQLAIDVEQWRRDIQTFSATTLQALNAIAGELSGECSNGSVRPTKNSSSRQSRQATQEPSETSNDDRLAKLKSQLAKRISKAH